MNKKYSDWKVILEKNQNEKIAEYMSNYHENDIADILEEMNRDERVRVYDILGDEKTADVFTYFDDAEKYVEELPVTQIARIMSHMDSDDAVDLLEKLEEAKKNEIMKLLEANAARDVNKILSYDENEIGSRMTTNFVCIRQNMSVRQAMSELVAQAGVHDNIMTVYVVDEDGHMVGAIELKKLITARENDDLNDIIIREYPHVNEHDKIDDCLERIVNYSEDSIPVLDDENRLLGVITAEDTVEIIDDEMGEDYAKLAGLTEQEDLTETTRLSVGKRLPWLLVLLVLGMCVSSLVGMFENVVAIVPVVICFQSLVLDMAGNVGTQSLAVTIRVLMDENVDGRVKLKLTAKEVKVGLFNGGILGIISFVLLGIYIHFAKGYLWSGAFAVSGCVGIALTVAMAVSALVGTVVPMLFKKIKIDPAVASGPLITTVNDLVAVGVYYSLAYMFLVK